MVCKICGKEIEEKKIGRKNSGFCSPNCYQKWRSQNLPKRHTKLCVYCGGEFLTNQTSQKYCSVACSQAAHKTGRTVYTKVCLYCGEEFKTIHKNNKYCNSTCASRHAADLRRGKYYCEYCGKPRHSDHPNRNRFCSRECAMKARTLMALLRREDKKKQSEQYRECEYCGEQFLVKRSKQRFCCDDCREKFKLKVDHDMRLAAFTPIVRECKHCGDTFITTFRSGNRLYCSEQ